jgi:hypothetical protein
MLRTARVIITNALIILSRGFLIASSSSSIVYRKLQEYLLHIQQLHTLGNQNYTYSIRTIMPPAILSIKTPYFTEQRSYNLIPFPCFNVDPKDPESEQFKASILHTLTTDGLSWAVEQYKMFDKDNFQPELPAKAALLSHFCFRAIFWEHEDITKPEERVALNVAVGSGSVDTVAKKLRDEIQRIIKLPEDSEEKRMWNLYTRPKDNSLDVSIEYHHTLQDILVEYVVRNGQDPGFLHEKETYGKFKELKGKIKVQEDGTRETLLDWDQVVSHLETVMHKVFREQPRQYKREPRDKLTRMEEKETTELHDWVSFMRKLPELRRGD